MSVSESTHKKSPGKRSQSAAGESPAWKTPAPASGSVLRRHIGPNPAETRAMLDLIGCASLDELASRPCHRPSGWIVRSNLPAARSEHEALAALRTMAPRTRCSARSSAGLLRLHHAAGDSTQHPGKSRLVHAIHALPGRDFAGPARGAAEFSDDGHRFDRARHRQRLAARRSHRLRARPWRCATGSRETNRGTRFFVSETCHPQKHRRRPDPRRGARDRNRRRQAARRSIPIDKTFGALLQYPDTYGAIHRYAKFIQARSSAGAKVAVATDLLALTLIKPPGEFGADIAVGSAQRFGVPLGYGGPHAAFLATRDEFKRHTAGAAHRRVARMRTAGPPCGSRCGRASSTSAATRRPATSAPRRSCSPNMASMYAVYHGPEGLREIAERVHALTAISPPAWKNSAAKIGRGTVIRHAAHQDVGDGEARTNWSRKPRRADKLPRDRRRTRSAFRWMKSTTAGELATLLANFRNGENGTFGLDCDARRNDAPVGVAGALPPSPSALSSRIPVFNRYHSETEMLRYIRGLNRGTCRSWHSMIPLGSCTMKLNAAAEMFPVSWPEFARIHPFAPIRPDAGLPEAFRAAGNLAGGNHRLCRRLPAAQCRVAGRIRRVARRFAPITNPAEKRTATSA